MDVRATLYAVALVAIPSSAHGQSVPDETPETMPTPIAVTRVGTFATLEDTIVGGMTILETQSADIDGDGDLDALVMVDVANDGSEPKLDGGRGIAVVFHDGAQWRAETIASVPYAPLEAGYNWGGVETFQSGGAPLVHVRYSEAPPGTMARESDTVLHFDRGRLRPVYARTVDSHADESGVGVVRSLFVAASDVNGDGTAELVERVESRRCAAEACFQHASTTAGAVTRRVMHWNATRGRFVAAESAATRDVTASTRQARSESAR